MGEATDRGSVAEQAERAALAHIREELPGWTAYRIKGGFLAAYPNGETGIQVRGPSPAEVIERARALERTVFMVLGRDAASTTGFEIVERLLGAFRDECAAHGTTTDHQADLVADAERWLRDHPYQQTLAERRRRDEAPALELVHVSPSARGNVEIGYRRPIFNNRDIARAQGYEGDPCDECGALTLVRNGACMKCMSCGAQTGCS